jgi:hypothetical protein
MEMWTASARRQYQRLGRCYASDLTDEEFAVIEPMLPPANPGGRGTNISCHMKQRGRF